MAESTALYKTKDWKRLRANQLKRQPWCELALKQGRKVKATVVHHKKAHRGDPALFFDPRNLESLSKSAHDTIKQSREKGGKKRAVGVDGWPINEE